MALPFNTAIFSLIHSTKLLDFDDFKKPGTSHTNTPAAKNIKKPHSFQLRPQHRSYLLMPQGLTKCGWKEVDKGWIPPTQHTEIQ